MHTAKTMPDFVALVDQNAFLYNLELYNLEKMLYDIFYGYIGVDQLVSVV